MDISPLFRIIINIGNARTRYIHYAWGKWRHFIILWRQLIGRSRRSTPLDLSNSTSKGGVHENPERAQSPRFGKPPADPRVREKGDLSPPFLNTTHTYPRVGWRGWFPSLWALSSSPSPPLSTRLFVHPPSLLFSRMPPATSFSLLSFFLFFFLLLLPSILKEERRCNFHAMPRISGRRPVAAK